MLICRLSQKVIQYHHEKYEVTALCPSPDKIHLAAGYSNGVIEIYNLPNELSVFSVTVHRTAVNVLKYDEIGLKLVSGGQDTDIITIDIVSQVGVCRLRGHTGPITDTCFYTPLDSILISSSKDTQIKFWNLTTQTCFKTIIDHRSEVWHIALMRDCQYLISGSSDTTLNVYKIQVTSSIATEDVSKGEANDMNGNLDEDTMCPLKINLIGTIQRAGRGRTINLLTDSTAQVLACNGTDATIELFRFCNQEEIEKRLAKRLKKLSVTVGKSTTISTAISDEIRRLPSIKVGGKVKSIDLLIGLEMELRVVATLANNSIKLFSLNVNSKKDEPNLVKSILQPGHHSEVRSICFSSDGLSIASGCSNSLKLWNRKSMKCVRTIEETGHILCCIFVPGDRHALLGCKNGKLVIVDMANGEKIEEIPAHTTELWAIALQPDLKGCVTGGGDATIKLWSFELISSENSASTLSLLHCGTYKLDETVLCIKISSNSKFIAIGLLDSTVKIFFLDSFKFYLSLYGHKLPVLCLDISSDSRIIATGSADRNVKIWGMDFGDCHRSLFAHDDSVMALQFVNETHMFWTCGKDGSIKQWDGDSFEKILTLDGHIGEAYNLAVSIGGQYLVSCGSDHVLRLYERTQEPIVLQDVQEEEREAMENRTLATGDDTTIPIMPNFRLPSQKTIGSEKGAESILECLEIGRKFDESDDKTVPPIMLAYQAQTSVDYLIGVLAAIRASDLEESLVLLPFSAVTELLEKIPQILENRKDFIELVCKIVLFLFRIHQKPIVGNHTLLPILQQMIVKLEQAIAKHRDVIGENNYGFQLLQRDIEQRDGVELFRDITRSKKQKDKQNKRKHLAKRLYIQMN